MLDTLKHLQRNPFFRTVGRFKGLNQESLVLQRASGYSQVYRTWNLLRRAYSLKDGIYRLQSKDIATLYEIWCFIEVSQIVREQLGITPEDMEHRNRMEMNGVFTWELGKGEHSRILFRKDGVELAELVYNPKHTTWENDRTGIKNLVVPTVPQKPDIVLQLSKDDVQNGMKTYSTLSFLIQNTASTTAASTTWTCHQRMPSTKCTDIVTPYIIKTIKRVMLP